MRLRGKIKHRSCFFFCVTARTEENPVIQEYKKHMDKKTYFMLPQLKTFLDHLNEVPLGRKGRQDPYF